MNKYIIWFETDLNASMKVTILAKNRTEAEAKLKKEYPSAFRIEIHCVGR